MVQIAICDMQEGQYIESLLTAAGQEYKLHRFEDAGKLLAADTPFDIIMLDGTKFKEVSGRKTEPILIKNGSNYQRVARKDILYVESSGRKLIVHTRKQSLECYGRISDFEEKLGTGFYRCHRGYLVNLAAVESYDSTSITVNGGEVIFLSKQKYHGFTERYLLYLKLKEKV